MTTNTLRIESFEPEDLARLAKLRYVSDEQAGFTREKNGSGFYYRNGRGLKLRAKVHITRIESLAIPPAWAEVWICRFAEGHLQATGRDDRQRKQYIYHERWREVSNLAKFWRLRHCARFLPKLRRNVAADLRGRGLTRNRVLAGMVALLDQTSIRIGNEEYVRQNKSYGLSSLRNRHVTISGGRATLQFRGKSGLRREAEIVDKRLVRLLKALKELPGTHVFQYVDAEGNTHLADAIAVNEYLRDRTPQAFTAKDFRTWKASALAAALLYEDRDVESAARRKRVVSRTIAAVADVLGNTPTVCRKYYIHAGLVDAYLEGGLAKVFQRYRPSRRKSLAPEEQILAYFLRRWQPFG
jgi:DNA topoisomerase I